MAATGFFKFLLLVLANSSGNSKDIREKFLRYTGKVPFKRFSFSKLVRRDITNKLHDRRMDYIFKCHEYYAYFQC